MKTSFASLCLSAFVLVPSNAFAAPRIATRTGHYGISTPARVRPTTVAAPTWSPIPLPRRTRSATRSEPTAWSRSMRATGIPRIVARLDGLLSHRREYGEMPCWSADAHRPQPFPSSWAPGHREQYEAGTSGRMLGYENGLLGCRVLVRRRENCRRRFKQAPQVVGDQRRMAVHAA